jgi:hypothetical protein
MIHVVIQVDRATGKVTYLSSWPTAEQAYADAMSLCTRTHGVWHAEVDKKFYVNELLDATLSIQICPLLGERK